MEATDRVEIRSVVAERLSDAASASITESKADKAPHIHVSVSQDISDPNRRILDERLLDKDVVLVVTVQLALRDSIQDVIGLAFVPRGFARDLQTVGADMVHEVVDDLQTRETAGEPEWMGIDS